MPETFNIRAGNIAMEHIQKHGLHPKDIDVIVGAAGGPKWIVLYGLDQYFIKEWFSDLACNLHLVGSSAGAWRLLCYALDNSSDAIERFLKVYIEQEYESRPSQDEVTDKLRDIVAHILNGERLSLLNKNALKKLYVLSSLSTFKKKEGSQYKREFLTLFLKNIISRKTLARSLDRVIFTNSSDTDFIKGDKFKTHYIRLNEENINDAVRSSGTLPMYMDPVENINGANGLLWDGALIDYHIGLDYRNEGLILYPHFSDQLIEGWFDKFVPWRKYKSDAVAKMIIISPSNKFIKSLPDSKIPDREDFTKYMSDNASRIKNWHIVSNRSKEIATEFNELWNSGRLYDHIDTIQ